LPAGANHGVGLVNKEDDRLGGGLDLFDQAFEPVFEFALDARACLQKGEIETVDTDVLERWGHIALSDAQREPFYNRGFSHSRFAGEDGIILAATHQNVDDLADFMIASEDGVDFSVACTFCQVDRVLIQVRGLAGSGGGGRSGCVRIRQRRCSFGGHLRDGQEFFLESLDWNFFELATGILQKAM